MFLFLTEAEAGTAATYSLTGTVKSKDTLVRSVQDDGTAYYDTSNSSISTIAAVLPFTPDSGTINPSELVLYISDEPYSPASWGEQVVISGSVASKNLTYKYYETVDDSYEMRLVGTLNVSWTASLLKINGTFQSEIFNAFDWLNTEDPGKQHIYGESIVILSFGGLTIERQILFAGSDTITVTTKQGNDYTLHNLVASGAADVTPPSLSILWPSKTLVTNKQDMVFLYGIVNDASGIYNIYAQVSSYTTGESIYLPVTDISGKGDYSEWAMPMTPDPGTNIVTIYAYDNANNLTTAQRLVVYKQYASLTLITNGSGSIAVAGMNKGRVEVGAGYKVTLTPAKGYVLADWAWYSPDQAQTYGIYYDYGWRSSFSFIVPDTNTVLAATFIKNPFANFKGSYTAATYDNYLVLDVDDSWGDYETLSTTNIGLFTLSVTTNGAASGKWTRRTGSISFSGTLHPDTYYSLPEDYTSDWWDWKSATNQYYIDSNAGLMQFYLGLDATDLTSVFGRYDVYSDPGEQDYADTLAYGSVSGYRNCTTTTNTGAYNIGMVDDLSMGADAPVSTARMGFSYATASVAATGATTVTLYPADGIGPAATIATAQGVDGSFFIYSPLYSKGGYIGGRLSIANGSVTNFSYPDQDYSYPLYFVKPTSAGAYYPDGFTNALYATGRRYTAPKAGATVITWTSGSFDAWDSDSTLAAADLTFGKNVFTVLPNSYQVSLSLKPATGVITGSFVPAGGKKTPFNGVVIDSENAVGFFKEKSTTGGLNVAPK